MNGLSWSFLIIGMAIIIFLALIVNNLHEANRLKKIELKHLGVPEKEIKGK